jgi:hypothetical protein
MADLGLAATLNAVLGAAPGVSDVQREFLGVTPTRTDADNAVLDSLVGRVVARYYGGYGTFRVRFGLRVVWLTRGGRN